MYDKPVKLIRKATEAIIIFLFAIMVLVVFLQVVARYVFNSPPSWTEELARYCQVWIVILTSSVCIRKGTHLAVDYLSHRMSAILKAFVKLLINFLIAVYAAVVTVFGWKLMIVGQYQVSPAIQINMSHVYLIFPLGGSLMFLEAVLKLISLLRKKEVLDSPLSPDQGSLAA